jgi:hypothetical protein
MRTFLGMQVQPLIFDLSLLYVVLAFLLSLSICVLVSVVVVYEYIGAVKIEGSLSVA